MKIQYGHTMMSADRSVRYWSRHTAATILTLAALVTLLGVFFGWRVSLSVTAISLIPGYAWRNFFGSEHGWSTYQQSIVIIGWSFSWVVVVVYVIHLLHIPVTLWSIASGLALISGLGWWLSRRRV